MIPNILFKLPSDLHHCIRNHTDASLQSRSIFHQIVCNQLPDLVLHIILLCTSRHTTKHTWKDVLRNGTIHVDHLVQMTDVHQTISRATRHLRVDLGNHDISTLSSSTRCINTRSQRTEPMLICTSSTATKHTWRRQLEKTDVQVISTTSEKVRNLAKEDRNIIILTRIHSFSSVTAYEEIASVENAIKLCSDSTQKEIPGFV